MTNSVDQAAASDAAAIIDRSTRRTIRDQLSVSLASRCARAVHMLSELGAVVLTGTGDKSFCAGADLQAIARGENLYHPGIQNGDSLAMQVISSISRQSLPSMELLSAAVRS